MASIVALFIFGLVGITMLMGMLKVVVRLPIESVLAISLLPLLLWLIIEGIFIRLLLRRTKEQTELAVPKQQVTNELDATRVRALPEPIPSVTEHTTRAFDPVFNDRK